MPEALRRQLLIIALAATVGLEFMQSTMLSFAAATVMGNVGATPEQFTWAVTAYAIVSVLVIAKTGWFVDKLGYRTYLIGSVLVFSLGALACGFASSPHAFIWARALQALGGGALFTTSRVALQDMFGADRAIAGRRYFYGVFTGILLALTLGTAFASADAWRWIFWAMVPLGLATAGLLHVAVPAVGAREGRSGFHFGGLLLLAFGISALQLFAQRVRFASPDALWSMGWLAGGSALALMVFLRHQWGHERPIINMRALKRRTFALGIFLYVAYYATSNAFGYVYSVFAATQRLPLEATGHVQAASALASLAFAYVYYHWIVRRLKDKNVLLPIGFAASAVVNLALAHLSPDAGAQSLTWPLVAKGVATILVVMPIPALTFNDLAGPDFADGYRLKNIIRQLCAAGATSTMILVMDHRVAAHQVDLASRFDTTSPAYQQFVAELQARSLAAGLSPLEEPLVRAQVVGSLVQRQATLSACSDGFTLIALGFALFAAALLGFYVLRRLKPLPAEASAAVEPTADA